jgi:hypothetical protein
LLILTVNQCQSSGVGFPNFDLIMLDIYAPLIMPEMRKKKNDSIGYSQAKIWGNWF